MSSDNTCRVELEAKELEKRPFSEDRPYNGSRHEDHVWGAKLDPRIVGLGMGVALLEETIYDSRYAKPLNTNYSNYLVANTDIPNLDCAFLNFPDAS